MLEFAWQQILLCVRVVWSDLCESCVYERLTSRRVTIIAWRKTLQYKFKSIDREDMHVHVSVILRA